MTGNLILTANPDGLAFATGVTSRRPPRPEMFLVVKASYRIRPGAPLEPIGVKDAPPTGDTFHPDDPDASGEVVLPSDFAHQKLKPEIIVRASCHTPKGRPQRECMVGVTVDKWSKRLRVVGTRLWVEDALGGAASEPAPFTKMPVTWTNAFGGPGVADNPVGKGIVGNELPNVELENQPVKKKGGAYQPAGFGPINPLWPVRQSKMGKEYGDKWRETRAPFVSEDFDWTYHQSAPPDQWLETLRGDERLVFENLHPATSELVVDLPKIRIVAFGRRKASGSPTANEGREIEPIPMALDTLYVDLETSTLSLVWRGHMSVKAIDLADVHSVIFASEPLGAAARSRTSYEKDLVAFEADPTGIGAVKQEIEARFRALEADAPAPPEVAPGGAVDPVTRKLDAVFSEDSLVRRHVRAAMDQALAGKNGAELRAALEKAEATGTTPQTDEPPVPYGQPGTAPSTGLRRKMRPAAEKIAAVKTMSTVPPELAARALEAEARLRGPELAKADPEYTYPAPLSEETPGPGRDLVDRDFTGQDLSKMDLRGARLDGAVLTRANLAGADLRGATLRGALLFRTVLTGANLSQTDLCRANLANAEAKGAKFDGAQLLETFFQGANLDGASFVGAKGAWPVFERASMRGADIGKVSFERADFGEADLTGMSARSADLSSSLFERTNATDADFSDTLLAKSCARDAKLTNAKFVRARAERSCFDGADLSGADLSLARMRGTHFTEACMEGAEVFGADLAEARLYRGNLCGAVFDSANLYCADLVRTRVDRTSFKKANLWGARLLDAAGEGADFSGASLDECVYTRTRALEGDG